MSGVGHTRFWVAERHDRDHRVVLIDHGQRIVHEIGAPEGMRGEGGRLHEFQCRLARGRIGEARPGGHQSIDEAVARRDRTSLTQIPLGMRVFGNGPCRRRVATHPCVND